MQALDVVKLLTPRIRSGGVVLTDDVGGLRGNFNDRLACLRDRTNGFDSMLIPLKGGRAPCGRKRKRSTESPHNLHKTAALKGIVP